MPHRCYGILVLIVTGSLSAADPASFVISGGGKLPEPARTEFLKLAGGKANAKLVVLATVAEEKWPGLETLKNDWSERVASVAVLAANSKEQASEKDFAKPLADATAVWIDGGNPNRFAKFYHGTPVETELQNLFRRGGAIGGNSAGAVVLSDLAVVGDKFETTTAPGLGLLPGVVIESHYTQRKRSSILGKVLEKHPSFAGLGIDENTALIVRGRNIRVVGEGNVTACWSKSPIKPAREDVLKNGEQLDLEQIRRAAQFRAMKEPFPAKNAAVPVVPKGTLVIIGGGGTTKEIMDRFFEAAGGKDALIVSIPTADLREDIPADPGDSKFLRQWGGTNIKTLHTRDRKVANDPEFSKLLLEAQGVWWGGGRQWRFVDSYEGTLTEKRIREVLDRGGVIGGSSAGASIQSEYMPRGHPLGNTVMAAEGYERGFGYLPGCAVDQHFFARKRTGDMTGLMKQYPQLLGIGIDEATALVVTGSTAEVLGKSKVGFYDYRDGPPEGQDFTVVESGGKYDLKNRKVMK